MSKPAPAAAAAAVESAEGQETAAIPLLVDGEIVKKPLKEVAALAQKGLAGDNRLDEAKRLLKLAEERELRSRAPEHPPGASPLQEPAETDPSHVGPGDREHQPAAGVPREKLAAIVERIQVGDSDDGTAALEELVGLMNAGRPKTEQFSREDVGQIVQQTIVARETQTEIDGALKTFGTKFPGILSDPDYRARADRRSR